MNLSRKIFSLKIKPRQLAKLACGLGLLAGIGACGAKAASADDETYYKTAMVNSYVYDQTGNRLKVKKITAGKAVLCHSNLIYVNDKPYIMIGNNKYVAYMNVVGLDVQLKHNSYIYNSKGIRRKYLGSLVKNGSVTLYGGARRLKYGGKSKYWSIGVGLYIKSANIKIPKTTVAADPTSQNQTTSSQPL